MELVLAAFTTERIFLRIQPSHDDGGWWLAGIQDFDEINGSDWSYLEDFILNTGQIRLEPSEILARELVDDW